MEPSSELLAGTLGSAPRQVKTQVLPMGTLLHRALVVSGAQRSSTLFKLKGVLAMPRAGNAKTKG